MDPQETLKRIRELTSIILDEALSPLTTHYGDLAAQIDALDEWIMNSGPLPLDWHIAQAMKLQYNPRRPAQEPEENQRPGPKLRRS